MPTSNGIRFVAALGLYIVSSGLFCCELVAGNPAALQRVCETACVAAYLPCLLRSLRFPVCVLLLEEACRYRGYFEANQRVIRKSDSGEDCRWTVALRHSSRVRSTNLVSELHRRTTSEGIRRTKEGVLRRAAVSKWTQKFYRKVGQHASHDVL